MKIAVVGAGISGLVAAYRLSQAHEVHVFEQAERIGGHTATVDIEYKGEEQAIDTGFIVYNERTYPEFIRLLDELGVASQETTMGFSVKVPSEDIEYAGATLKTLFAQKKNVFSLKFHRMWIDILRFNARAKRDWRSGAIDSTLTLKEYLDLGGYGEYFHKYYLLPMGAAIWSSSIYAMNAFPAQFFVRFFYNHGLLDIKQRPKWRVLTGGSRSYLEPLTRSFKNRITTSARIKQILRNREGVSIEMEDGKNQFFDQVVIATHSDQALSLLGDADEQEQSILSAIPYANNSVVLHTDETVLPKCKETWSSWNYAITDAQKPPVLSYNMNILQGLNSKFTYCVTLNDKSNIDRDKIIAEFNYAHPQFSHGSETAQAHWPLINGHKRTWFCGAYWANGFHEDGVVSANRVVTALNAQA